MQDLSTRSGGIKGGGIKIISIFFYFERGGSRMGRGEGEVTI